MKQTMTASAVVLRCMENGSVMWAFRRLIRATIGTIATIKTPSATKYARRARSSPNFRVNGSIRARKNRMQAQQPNVVKMMSEKGVS